MTEQIIKELKNRIMTDGEAFVDEIQASEDLKEFFEESLKIQTHDFFTELQNVIQEVMGQLMIKLGDVLEKKDLTKQQKEMYFNQLIIKLTTLNTTHYEALVREQMQQKKGESI